MSTCGDAHARLSQCAISTALLLVGHTSLFTRSRSSLAISRHSSLPRRFWKEKGAATGMAELIGPAAAISPAGSAFFEV